jgi:hypothetical protein
MNNASGPAGGSRCEVVLFEQKRAFAGSGALTRDGDTVDAATNHNEIEVLGLQLPARWSRISHPPPLDAEKMHGFVVGCKPEFRLASSSR